MRNIAPMKSRMRQLKRLIKRKPTVSKLKARLDAVFSLYIRIKFSDENGIVACYTCGAKMHWKKIQNGHFVSRQYNAVRYEERNCRPQCYSCNYLHRGNYATYSLKLINEKGVAEIEWLESQKRVIKQFVIRDLEMMIEHFSLLVKEFSTASNNPDYATL